MSARSAVASPSTTISCHIPAAFISMFGAAWPAAHDFHRGLQRSAAGLDLQEFLGATWGMDGYFMIRMGYDECGIESWAPLWCEPGVAVYPNLTVGDYTVAETIGDNDGVLNPGETAQLTFSLQNAPLAALAAEVHIQITTDDPRGDHPGRRSRLPESFGQPNRSNSDP